MPDPWQYAMAVAAAGLVSMLGSGILAFYQTCPLRVRDASVLLVICAGIVAGCKVLQFPWTWPPRNALDRFLTIVLPCVVMAELFVAAIRPAERTREVSDRSTNCKLAEQDGGRRLTVVMLVRLLVCVGCGRTLLHNSVCLQGTDSASMESWTMTQALAILGAGVLLLAFHWGALARLSQLENPESIGFGLVMTIFTAGLITMLGGYIKGGAAALPLGGALLGSVIALSLRRQPGALPRYHFDNIIGMGVVALFSLLWIARFFGNVSSGEAVMIFLSPLAGWLTEVRGGRAMAGKKRVTIRLLLTSIPLLLLLWTAWIRFEAKMSPLLAERSVSEKNPDGR